MFCVQQPTATLPSPSPLSLAGVKRLLPSSSSVCSPTLTLKMWKKVQVLFLAAEYGPLQNDRDKSWGRKHINLSRPVVVLGKDEWVKCKDFELKWNCLLQIVLTKQQFSMPFFNYCLLMGKLCEILFSEAKRKFVS